MNSFNLVNDFLNKLKLSIDYESMLGDFAAVNIGFIHPSFIKIKNGLKPSPSTILKPVKKPVLFVHIK